MAVRVGDVVRSGKRWGRLSTSHRDSCPACSRFMKTGASQCTSCGAVVEPVAEGLVEVIGLGG